MGEIAIQLASIPEEVTECTRNSVSDFADLDITEKTKMIRQVAGKSSQIKDRCEDITETMKQVKTDFEGIRDSMEIF